MGGAFRSGSDGGVCVGVGMLGATKSFSLGVFSNLGALILARGNAIIFRDDCFFDVFVVASPKRFFECTAILFGCSGCSGSAEVSQIVCEARHGALKCRK